MTVQGQLATVYEDAHIQVKLKLRFGRNGPGRRGGRAGMVPGCTRSTQDCRGRCSFLTTECAREARVSKFG